MEGVFADPHKPLRDDVRLLGELLGEVLRAREGDAVFSLVEEVRAMAKRARSGAGQEFDALAARLRAMSVEAALPVARAFAHFLTLANIAEQHHRTRRRRAYAATPAAPPQRGSCEHAFPALLAAGVSPEQLHHAVCHLRIELVLTAHPTEVVRRTLIQKHKGFRFAAAMGGETAVGSEVVVVMQKHETAQRYRYALLATSKTSTMQKELQAAAAAGFEYVGQTVFKSMFGGREVACILERDTTAAGDRYEYRLVATTKTSTMQKELQEAGDQNFEMVGLTVGQTALGGNELVSIVRRKVQ